MKTATVRELKQDLSTKTSKELIDLCLRLSKFKKDNKELLTYLLFESMDEEAFIEGVKNEVEETFATINNQSYYYINKSIRKIYRILKKYIRYSQKKETEVELLLHFCQAMQNHQPSIFNSVSLESFYSRQIIALRKAISTLHEDLQYDYELELQAMGEGEDD